MLLFAVGICSGCGGTNAVQRASVEGAVTWNGEPVTDGVVLFFPPPNSAGPPTSPVPAQISQGSYALDAQDGPVVGKNRIEVRAVRKTGKRTPEPSAAMKHFDPTLKSVELTEQFLPPQFNTASTLTKDIQAGPNLIDFNLTDK